MKRAVIHGRFAHETDDALIATAIFDGETNAGGHRDMSANDAVSAQESKLLVEHVHGSAFALGASILSTEQFRHHRIGRHATHQRLTMIAIRRDDVVIRTQCHDDAGGHRFLANVQVAEATNLANRVHLRGAFFEAALQQH